MKVLFAGKPLKRCPIIFCVMKEEDPNKVCPEKVVVLGPGLTTAFCNEEAEFIVDGSNAGPGKWLSTFIFFIYFNMRLSQWVAGRFCTVMNEKETKTKMDINLFMSDENWNISQFITS